MNRTNFDTAREKCKLICNVCYVDTDVLNDVLLDKGIDPNAEYNEEDAAKVVESAILVVNGWVETSRSEGGISTSINHEAVKNNIVFWCNRYGLDVSELLGGTLSSIENGSNRW
jgi:hypothetical protein